MSPNPGTPPHAEFPRPAGIAAPARRPVAGRIEPAPGLTLVGWKYSHDLISPDATILPATKDHEKVVVIADRKMHDRRLSTLLLSGLRVHKREIADLILYEISRLPGPVVLDHVHVGPAGGVAPRR
jgi:hypothetical protein